ncbi:hypothetical protein ACFFF7_10975 [Novosphingobium aquiterrae]|uniref:DUF2231 domain-containing protein n=1 Tax=Novosphingobium aquiterrae TaxID=624388 RepID=A0ABV6PJC4_9SPHN
MSTKMSPAARRYTLRLAVLMTIYVATLFFAKWMFKHQLAHGALAYALAILPGLPIIGVFWAVMRLIVEEKDEFVRLLHVRQALVATGFCLTVMTVWEWLQNFDLVAPGNGGFGAAFFWFAGLGVGALYNRLTLGTSGDCA